VITKKSRDKLVTFCHGLEASTSVVPDEVEVEIRDPDPGRSMSDRRVWIPACAGTTEKLSDAQILKLGISYVPSPMAPHANIADETVA